MLRCNRSIHEMRSIANRTAALEASERNFRELFEEAPIGMAVVGLDDKFQQTNRALSQMLDYSREEFCEFIRQSIASAVSGQPAPHLSPALHPA